MAAREVGRRLRVARRGLVAPKPPVRDDGRVLIHLGCGEIAAPGWINVDVQALPHIHHVTDVRRLDAFATGTVDLVYACHVLEHVSHRETRAALVEWRRVLKPGGVLRLSVPDFDLLVDAYLAEGRDVDKVVKPVLGGQRAGHDFHGALFTERSLRGALSGAGFTEVRRWRPGEAADHDFPDWAAGTIEFEGRSYAVSLNLEVVK